MLGLGQNVWFEQYSGRPATQLVSVGALLANLSGAGGRLTPGSVSGGVLVRNTHRRGALAQRPLTLVIAHQEDATELLGRWRRREKRGIVLPHRHRGATNSPKEVFLCGASLLHHWCWR